MLNINALHIHPVRYQRGDTLCYSKVDLLQFNKYIESGVWIDEIGKHDGTPNEGGVYVFNGNALYIGIANAGETVSYLKLGVSGVQTTVVDASGYIFDGISITISWYSHNSNESYCEQTKLYDDGVDTNVLLTNTTGVTHRLLGDDTDFFDTSQDVISKANEVGWGTITAQAGLIVPLDSVTNQPRVKS